MGETAPAIDLVKRPFHRLQRDLDFTFRPLHLSRTNSAEGSGQSRKPNR